MKVRVLRPEHLDKKLKLKPGATLTIDNPEYLQALMVAEAVEDASKPSSIVEEDPSKEEGKAE